MKDDAYAPRATCCRRTVEVAGLVEDHAAVRLIAVGAGKTVNDIFGPPSAGRASELVNGPAATAAFAMRYSPKLCCAIQAAGIVEHQVTTGGIPVIWWAE